MVETQKRHVWLLSEVREQTEEGQTIWQVSAVIGEECTYAHSTHISTKISRDCLSPYFRGMVHSAK